MNTPAGVSPSGVVTLLTDFGLRDPFVGVMKGVMLGIAPNVRFVDLTHGIPAQDVDAAAFWLARSVPYFPPGTVHLVVIDPTVGTARRAIAARAFDQYFVGPDNGVLALPSSPDERVVAVELDVGSAGPTFHGRDVFAPAAAQLASGVPIDGLGPRIAAWSTLGEDPPARRELEIVGRVAAVDHFGNLLTDIELPKEVVVQEVRCQGQVLPWGRTYADVEEGKVLALVNSWGLVELAVCRGSAAGVVGARPGDAVSVHLAPGQRR